MLDVRDAVIVGEYTADLLVEDQVIVELKVVAALSDVHVPQCRNDLRATGKFLCLLINFGRSKVEIRRVTPSFACSVAQA
jgi:GxxExxY protein